MEKKKKTNKKIWKKSLNHLYFGFPRVVFESWNTREKKKNMNRDENERKVKVMKNTK